MTVMLPQTLRVAIDEQVAAACASRYGNDLRAVVVTGSLARDEVTAREDQGRRRLLGDAEFLLIFHETARLPDAAARRRTTVLVISSVALCFISFWRAAGVLAGLRIESWGALSSSGPHRV